MVGISFAAIFVRLALPAPPVVTGFYRMLFATIAIAAAVALRPRERRPTPAGAATALAAGACFGADIAFWNHAIVSTSVATATLLVNVTPIHVGLWSLLVRREPLTARFSGGALLASSGAAVLLGISWDDVLHWQGAWLALTASVFYAGYLLLVATARRGVDAVATLLLTSAGATCVLGAAALLRGDPFSGFPQHSWAAMLGAALVSQLGGVLGIVWALRYLPTTVASVALLGQPVGTALLGWWLLAEPLTPLQSLGGGVVLAGIALTSSDLRRRTSV